MGASPPLDIAALQSKILLWVDETILTRSMAIESGLTVASLLVALALVSLLRPRLSRFAPPLESYPRLAARLSALSRLLLPAAWLAVLFVADLLSTMRGYDAGLCRVVMKLLAAWIGINLVTQVIGHPLARKLFTVVIWVVAALSIFGVLDEVSARLGGIGFSLGEFRITALGVIKGVLALAALLYGAMLLASFIDLRLARTNLAAGNRLLLGKITRIALVAIALLIAITTAGIDLSVLAVFGGALGLGIGFGLQRNFSNMFSGMMLLFDQSIRPGDVIEVPDPSGGGTTFGWVTHMSSRYTEIVTRDNKSFLIPNEQLITQQVVNWSHGDTQVRLKVPFGVHYKSDLHHVKRVAEAAAAGVARVEQDPKPACHLMEFGDSSINFSLRFWIRDAEKGVANVESAVLFALWEAFRENGIEFPYPHREVYLHTAKD